MNRTCVSMVVVSCIMSVICCCDGVEQTRTGFLSDYSRLQAVSDESYRYVDEQAVDKYSSFIVDEVKVHFSPVLRL